MIKIKKKETLENKKIKVYDISLDGTVVNALGGNVVSNTDGFNFQLPLKYRYTEENPYISTGGGRNSVKGKTYTDVDADVCEFEDLFFNQPWNGGVNKMGLGIDEFCDATCNMSRKNYCDLMPDGKKKLVGNSVKSRRMSTYIENFLDPGLDLLLHGKGYDFLNFYYEYIEKIYNYQIPVKDIASKGKIKKTLEDYKKDCETVTKAGTKKSKQAWYELAILNNLKVDLNDTIYYINTANKKSLSSDVKKVNHQYTIIDGEEVELKGKVKSNIIHKWCEEHNVDYKSIKTAQEKEILKPHIKREWEEVILNCTMIPLSIAESEENILCSDMGDDFEYNVDKYIDMFNKRIKILLVCFHPDIRSKILITKPSDRPQFTEKQCELCSGYPDKETDQDTYEQLMTPERKEIEFWLRKGERPPFVDECGIEWDKMVDEYLELKEKEKNEIFQEEDAKYLKALASLTKEDFKLFEEEDEIPKCIEEIVELHTDMHFYFKKLPDMRPSTGGNILDDLMKDSYSFIDASEEAFEKADAISQEN